MSLLNIRLVCGIKLEHFCNHDMVTALQPTLVKPMLLAAVKAGNSKYTKILRPRPMIFSAKLKCILNISTKNSRDSHKLLSILNLSIIIIILNYFKLNINSVPLVTCHLNKFE